MTRKLHPSSNRAIVGFIQYIHCIAVAYSAANEAQNKLLMEYHKIFSSERTLHRFTDVKAEYWCLCLLNTLLPVKMIFPFGQKASISHLLIRFNEVHSGFWNWLPPFLCQIPVRLSKQGDCQLSCCKEFSYRALPPPRLTLGWFRYVRKSGFGAQRCSAATVKH